MGAAGERVRAPRLETIRRIRTLAKDENVDFVLVAGDTFEDHGISKKLVADVSDLLSGFEQPVYMIPGNHDPFVSGGVWEQVRRTCRSNVHVLTERIPVEIQGGIVFPCPLIKRWSKENPTDWIPKEPRDRIRIGLAHGSLDILPGEKLDPIKPDSADLLGLDYLALGHWHSLMIWKAAGGASRVAYSGTPETSAFGETDSGNVLLVDIEAPGAPPILRPHRVGELRWWDFSEHICQPGEVQQLLKRLQDEPNADRTLTCLKLTGLLFAEDAEIARAIRDLPQKSIYLFFRLDDGLRPAPTDQRWITDLPEGLIRSSAQTLHRQSEGDPLAAQALIELFHIANGDQA